MPPAADDDALRRAEIILLRHAETVYNTENRLSGDPSLPIPLSERGRGEAAALRGRLEPLTFAATYVTRFPRTMETFALIVPDGRPEPVAVADLDDINVGEFEGRSRDDYRAWRRTHGIADAPRGGESRLSVVRRYSRGLGWLAENAPVRSLVVTHDQVLRYLENALAGEDPIFGEVGPIANATPYAYALAELAEGARRLEAYAAAAEASA